MGRRRSRVVSLGMTAALAASVAGCGSAGSGEAADSGDPQYVGVCLDKSTGVRLDDAVCAGSPLPPEADFTPAPAVDATAGRSDQPTTRPTPDSTVWTQTSPTPGATSTTSSPSTASPSTTSSPTTSSPTTTAPPQRTSHGWFFIPFGLWAPSIGSRATTGSYAPPAGATVSQGGMAKAGGSVSSSSVKGGKITTSRGGFGGSGAKAGS